MKSIRSESGWREMSPITANGSRFSNSAELLGLRDEIFPTAEVGSLFKLNRQNQLQSLLIHFFIILTKTHLSTSWKPHPILLGFSVSEFKNLGLHSWMKLLFSNAGTHDRSNPYTKKQFYPGNRGTCPHPQAAQTLNAVRSLLTPSPVSHCRRPHPLTRRGELAARASLFRGTPRSPARPATQRPLRKAAVTMPATPRWLHEATPLSWVAHTLLREGVFNGERPFQPVPSNAHRPGL